MMIKKLKSEKGQGLIEYSLLVALLAITAIAATKTLSTKACSKLATASTAIGGSAADPCRGSTTITPGGPQQPSGPQQPAGGSGQGPVLPL